MLKVFQFIICLIFFIPAISNADLAAKKQPEIQFSHTPPKLEQLPRPGLPMTLAVTMNKEVLSYGVKVRAIITRDGSLFEVQNTEPKVNSLEKVVFQVEIPSPLVDVNYQFIFTDKVGNAVATKRYSIRRNCMPDISLSKTIANSKDSVTKDDLAQLKATSDKLNDEIQLYEAISKDLTDIQQTIDAK